MEIPYYEAMALPSSRTIGIPALENITVDETSQN
jgi:hypothetical protein